MKVKDTIGKPCGICPASMITRNADQTYNKKGMEEYLTWLLDSGAQSISICGNTGENIAMNMEEQKEITEHVSGFSGGQVPLVYGTGRYNIPSTIKTSKFVQDHGTDYVMVILPFYLSPHKEAVAQRFGDLRKMLDIEIMVYSNSQFAGYELNIQEAEELADDGIIQCIETAHDDLNRVHELRYHCKDDLTVSYGHDYAAMEDLLAGADGWLSGFLAVLSKQCRRLQDAYFAKDVDVAIVTQNNIQPCIDCFFYNKANGVPHWQEICKYTLQAQGLDVGLSHRPLDELDDTNKKKTEKSLASME